MSLASKITLSLASVAAAAIITYVHYKHYEEQKKLQEGISKDLERQKIKKKEKMYWIEKQLEATEIFKREQSKLGKVTLPVIQD